MLSTIKVEVATVDLGSIQFDGYKSAEGQFYIGVEQATSILRYRTDNAAWSIKATLGAVCNFAELSTETASQTVTAITIRDLERFIVRLATKGNATALELVSALVGLSLTELYSDAFHGRLPDSL